MVQFRDGERMNRWARPVNVTLLALLVITTASGGLAFTVGSAPASTVVVAVHGASGLGLLLVVPAKVRIARRGLRRPGRSRKVISLALTVLALLAVASGLLHAIGGFRPYLGLLPMQIHVGAALVAVALLVAHVVAHQSRARLPVAGISPAGARRMGRWRPLLRRTDVDRRVALRGAAVVAGAAALWVVAPGRERRFTGSHEVGSGDPAVMPVTNWLFDPVPVLVLAASTWRLGLGTRAVDLDAVAALPQTSVRAVLDCTGGWYAEQEWRGVALADLGLPPSASVEVVSATGYRRRLPATAPMLLATHAAGLPLSAGHGGPMRLVAPGRRGFWWVKWVVAVEATDEPWWLQPPLPLQ
jgi:DMSO/TMAO reductase YedYZ molybdopterin-dependent catalytic subunit